MRLGQKMGCILDEDINGQKSLIRDICIVGASFTLNLYQDKS